MSTLFILGLMAHLFADWFLQSDWQAAYKTDLRHPAAWVHFGCHLVCMLLVWAPLPAVITAVSHAVIDTRKPLVLWRTLMRQKQMRPVNDKMTAKDTMWNVTAMSVAFWQDQAAHILVLGLLSYLFGGPHLS